MGQVAVSIACWMLLAVVVVRSLRHFGARVLAVTAILGFSCSMGVAQWDPALISESLSLSLLALLLVAALALMRRPSGVTVALTLAAMFLWAFTRDTNAFFLLFAGPLLALVLARRGRMRLALPLALGALVLSGASLSLGLAALLAVAVAGLAFAVVQGRVTWLDAAPLAFLATTLPGRGVLIWHTDAAEFDQHLFQGTALTRLSLLVLVVLAADRVLEWAREDVRLPAALQPVKGAA